MADTCQVDFYLLEGSRLAPPELACRLALMAWERGHQVTVIAGDDREAAGLDDLMWSVPRDRFVPHEITPGGGGGRAPVQICPLQRFGDEALKGGDVVINLSERPVPEPGRFNRLLEIVPGEQGQRAASRTKYRAYRQQGLQPATHNINT